MNKLLPLLFILLEACIDPLKVSQIHTDQQLVVDGLITNEPGPYQVRLFYSTTDLAKTLRRQEVETLASVTIESDNNESEKLIEVEPGLYETSVNGIHGKVGTSYRVKISTRDGNLYESDFQDLIPSGVLDSIFFSIKPNAIANHIISNHYSDGLIDALQILINAHGTTSQPNLFRWRWKGVYKERSFPELRTGLPCDRKCPPDPEPCSGYITDGVNIFKRSECVCCICWSTQYGSNAIISDNDYITDNNYKNVIVGELGVNPMIFYERLYIEVEQLSVSKEVHNFWKLVQKQQESVGNLFQPNAIQIQGNVYSATNPDEEVLGIFSASSVTRKSIFLDKSIIPYTLNPIDTIPYDCRYIFLNATTEKPPFW